MAVIIAGSAVPCLCSKCSPRHLLERLFDGLIKRFCSLQVKLGSTGTPSLNMAVRALHKCSRCHRSLQPLASARGAAEMAIIGLVVAPQNAKVR